MDISSTKSILPEKASFSAKLIHHEDINNYSPDNLPNFTNPLVSRIEAVNYTFTFKYATSQPDRLEFVEAMRKEIGAHEIDKNWTLVKIRELNGKKTIMSIWYFKINRALDRRVIKHKAHLCTHRGMQQWGVNYWYTYSPVVNWMSVIAILTLSILK